MAYFEKLQKELKSRMNDPKELVIMIITLVLLVDFLAKGKLGIINYGMYHIKTLFKAGDWQFPVIVLLLLLRK